ncbi:unnamed protein product, partial [Discosporangium mesarthrocarpum]
EDEVDVQVEGSEDCDGSYVLVPSSAISKEHDRATVISTDWSTAQRWEPSLVWPGRETMWAGREAVDYSKPIFPCDTIEGIPTVAQVRGRAFRKEHDPRRFRERHGLRTHERERGYRKE